MVSIYEGTIKVDEMIEESASRGWHTALRSLDLTSTALRKQKPERRG